MFPQQEQLLYMCKTSRGNFYEKSWGDAAFEVNPQMKGKKEFDDN